MSKKNYPPDTNQSKTEHYKEIFEKISADKNKVSQIFLKGTIPVAITTLAEGIFIQASDTFARMIGLTREEIIGRSSIEIGLITPEVRDLFIQHINEHGSINNFEMNFRMKNGNSRYYLLGAFKIEMENEAYLLIDMADITGLKQVQDELKKSQQKYRSLFNNVPIGIYQVTPEGRIITVNKTAARVLGYESPQDILDTVKDITHQIYTSPESRQKALALLKKNGFIEDYRLQVRQKNGNVIWVEAGVYIVRDDNGEVLYHEGTIKDITELVRAEEELKKSKDKYFNIYNNTAVGIYQVNPEGKFISANLTAARQLGYETPEELIMDIDDIETQIYVSPADREEVIARLKKDGFVDNMEVQFRRKDGNVVWHLISAHVVKDEQGKILYHEGTCKDITELKKMQEQLRSSESRYRQLYESMMDGFVSGDFRGYGIDANDAFLRMLGYAREELPQLNYKKITPEKWHALEDKIIKEQILERGYSDIFEKEYICKDGRIIPVELRTTLLKNDKGDPVGFWAIVRDISERKKAEKKLKGSEEKYRQLHESMIDGFAQVNMEGYFIDCNEALQEMTGYTREELLKLKYSELTPERWHALEDYLVKNQLFSRGYTETYEKEYIRKDGTVFPIELRSVLITNEEGKPVSIWAIIYDITERKRSQEDLARSEEKYRQLHQSMMDGFSNIDMKGRYVEFNDSFLDMLGYSPEELRQVEFRKITPEKWHKFEDTVIREQLFGRGYSDVYEKEYIRKDGTVFPVELRAVLLRDKQGKPVSIWAIIRDITERKREAERRARSEETYRLIAENVTDVIALLYKNGVIKYVSNSREILGYEPEELKGINSIDLAHPEDANLVTDLFREYTRKRWREITYEARVRHKEDRYVPLEIRVRLLTDEDGNIIGNVLGGRVISRRRQVNDDELLSTNPLLKDRRLTDREKEILKWIMNGKSTWDIARILNISESTVKFHVDHIMKKFNAVNRAHAVAIYLQKQQIGIL